MPDVHVQTYPADPGLGLPGRIIARAADGVDNTVEIHLTYDGDVGTSAALLLMARAAIEVCVLAREVPTPEVPSRESEGRRWND
jgi:hypothetical protein